MKMFLLESNIESILYVTMNLKLYEDISMHTSVELAREGTETDSIFLDFPGPSGSKTPLRSIESETFKSDLIYLLLNLSENFLKL